MPTIDSKKIVKEIIRNYGEYYDNPPVIYVHTYVNDWGGRSMHIAYNDLDVQALLTSPYCHNITPLWSRASGLTLAGKLMMEDKLY